MKMVRQGLVLAGMLCLAGMVNAAEMSSPKAAATQIAVLNVQQVLQQSPRVAELGKKLEAEFHNRQAKIGDEQKALQTSLDQFKQQSPTMSQKDRDAMQKKISTDRAELVKKVVAYQQDLQKEQNEVMQSVLRDLNNVVSSVAKQQSYSMVLDSQAVVYSANSTDITKTVADQFNK